MAAPSKKPETVHFFAIFLFLVAAVCGGGWYMTQKSLTETNAKLKTATDSAATANSAAQKTAQDLQEAKSFLGNQQPDIGTMADTARPNTVITEMTALINRVSVLAGENNPAGAKTITTVLNQFLTQFTSLDTDVKTLRKDKEDLNTQYQALLAQNQARVDELKAGMDKAEGDLQKLVTEKEEVVKSKDMEIARSDEELRRERVEKEQLRDELQRTKDDYEKRIANQNATINFYRKQILEITDANYEVADGMIRGVDPENHVVWINLGSLDNLRSQTTFSVYAKENSGVSRTQADIKAKIEVTEILGPHLAKARILQEDLRRPMAETDPIYSPIWHHGQKQFFSFVGLIDFDGDGTYDKKMLEDRLHAANADIEVLVNEQGVREPADTKMTVKTKFLVVGPLGDPTTVPGQDERQEQIRRTLSEHKALIDEATENGIRVVNLQDFLAMMGIEPQQRLYRPGDNSKFNLKAGARSTGVNDVGGDRSSSGQVSGKFTPDRIGAQKESSGQTSQRFRQ
jgi:hypothetical protein